VNIYHIASRAEWSAAREQGAYEPPSLASEGFVHCSTAAQVVPVANRFYAGQPGLVLLVIDPRRLTSALKWEHVLDAPAAVPGEQAPAYPHIHGPINLDAVTDVLGFEPGPDGLFREPTAVSPPGADETGMTSAGPEA
jgi:uncharacterized protein (DUF952 family)